jgi:hypothetical protein
MLDAGVSLRDVQIAARHADPRTTMCYDRARKNLARHPNYILVAVVTVAAGPAHAGPAPSAVTDVNPNSLTSGNLFGGRVVAFAVNPINTQLVFAASKFGGLWKSTNHGSSWAHIDQVPLTAMQDVQIASRDTNLVIATGAYDGSTDNRGGGICAGTSALPPRSPLEGSGTRPEQTSQTPN